MGKLRMMRILLLLILFLTYTQTQAFTVYQYIFWQKYIDTQGKVVNVSEAGFQKYMQSIKLKKLHVIYSDHILTNNLPDKNKIKAIAIQSQKYPMVPISFDLEIGDPNKPETILPIINQVIDLYVEYGGKAEIGVYGILPQNIHPDAKLSKETRKKLQQSNKQYEQLASKVNFLNPVIYNNWVRDYNSWKEHADFQIKQSKIYAKKYNLKIIPYMTGTYLFRKDIGKINKTIEYLPENEMSKRIQFVKNQGVDGVVIWEGSANDYKLTDGTQPIFNQYSGPYNVITKLANQQSQ